MSSIGFASPHVSVVMCTRNRSETIKQAVASVLASDHTDFDLTIIDQSTTEATATLLYPLMARDPRMRYVRAEEPGLSRAYNKGIGLTTGEILAFTDDDCIVPQNWLSAIIRVFNDDEEADLLYGQVLLPEGADTSGGMTPVLPILRPERLSRRDGFRIFGMGANFAARRRLFATIGGFDEMLGGGALFRSSQDFDLAYRTYLAGRAIVLRPEVTVVHYGTRTLQEVPATLRAYGIGDGAFYFKHVRCRDLFALRLLTRQVSEHFFRDLAFRLKTRGPGDLTYVRAVLEGIRQCLRLDVDRSSRMYISPFGRS